MVIQDEYGKFERIDAIDDHDIAVYYGTYSKHVSLREFYQFHAKLPTRVKVKETRARPWSKALTKPAKYTEKKTKTEKREKKKKIKEPAFRITVSKRKGSVSTAKQTEIDRYVQVRKERGRDIQHETIEIKT